MSYQACLDSIKEKTDKSPGDFKAIAEKKGLLEPGVKTGAVVAWLKEDYGLSHGPAMANCRMLQSASAPKESTDEAVANHLLGGRAVRQLAYERLVGKDMEFGSDASIQAGESDISLLRSGKWFGIVHVTTQRFDVGIKLKAVEPADRFAPAGDWNATVTDRVSIGDSKQVDAELARWLRNAHEKS